jgi:hypothetical protein
VVAFVTEIVGTNVVVSDTQVVVGRGVVVDGGRVLMIGVQVSASPLMHSFSFRSKMNPAEQYLIVACFLSHFTYRSHLFGCGKSPFLFLSLQISFKTLHISSLDSEDSRDSLEPEHDFDLGPHDLDSDEWRLNSSINCSFRPLVAFEFATQNKVAQNINIVTRIFILSIACQNFNWKINFFDGLFIQEIFMVLYKVRLDR